jgi:hypothetical protein
VSFASATILLVVFIVPGVMFVSGLVFRDRFRRSVVQANVIGEVAFALVVAIVLHLAVLVPLGALTGVTPATVLSPVLATEEGAVMPEPGTLQRAALPVLVYAAAIAVVGFLLGLSIGSLIRRGRLRFFATHRWAYDLMDDDEHGAVWAHVMTDIVNDGSALMFSGALREFYLTEDGRIAHLVLSDCDRFFMPLQPDMLRAGQRKLFDPGEAAASRQVWNYLSISGEHIANVAFEKLPRIVATAGSVRALEEALRTAGTR